MYFVNSLVNVQIVVARPRRKDEWDEKVTGKDTPERQLICGVTHGRMDRAADEMLRSQAQVPFMRNEARIGAEVVDFPREID